MSFKVTDIPTISKNIEGVKFTHIYLISTDLYKVDNKKLINKINSRFSNHFGIIQTIKNNNKDKHLFIKEGHSWSLPHEYQYLNELVNRKSIKLINNYGYKLENEKNSLLFGNDNNLYTKYIWAPLIEILGKNIHLHLVTLTVFNNGSILIELIEDLENLLLASDFYNQVSFVEKVLYPDFRNQKNTIYYETTQKGLSDIIDYLLNEMNNIYSGINYERIHFNINFISNVNNLNKLPFFKDYSLPIYLVNAPYINESLKDNISLKDSKNLKIEISEIDDIKYINKATNYVVWTDKYNDLQKNEKLLRISSLFLVSAIPFFQGVALDETILKGLDKFKIKNEKVLLRFNEWVLNYKKTFIHLYRSNYVPVTNLYKNLSSTSDFTLPEQITNIQEQEKQLIKDKNDFISNNASKVMNIILFIVTVVSLLQVIDIFTDNRTILSMSGLLILIITISVIIINKFKL